jgi:serine/threonine-protein kinase RsbW
LPKIRKFVNSWLGGNEVTGKTANQIVLAIDEACANSIIHHHKCDNTSHIEVCLCRKEASVLIEIKDTGKAFRIDEYKPHGISENIRRRHKGGLGIYLINMIMDEIEVKEGNGGYVYKFTKHVGTQPFPSSNI